MNEFECALIPVLLQHASYHMASPAHTLIIALRHFAPINEPTPSCDVIIST